MKRLLVGLLAASLALSGCRNTVEIEAPPRVDTAPQIKADMSTLKAPLTVSLDQLQGALERRVPRELWSIDERRKDCVPAQRIRPLGVNIKVSPDISCRIRGNVTRGRLRLDGRGQDLLIRLPVKAVLRAEGVVWLTGELANDPDSAVVRIENFALTGESDRESANLLARLFMDEEMQARIEQSLVADFSKDYDRVVADARTALRSLSADGVTFSASVDEVHHGQIQVTGQGLLLPVTASGRGSLSATIR